MLGEKMKKTLLKLGTCMLSDAMGKRGAMDSSIKAVFEGARLVGPAFTVDCPFGDNLPIHHALAIAPAGSILVVDAKWYNRGGLFGEILATQAKTRGVAGLVMEGTCRDVKELRRLSFPVFATGVNPGGTVKATTGVLGAPIQCGGVVVCPGDFVVGDENGIVVISQNILDDVIRKAENNAVKEKCIIERIAAGEDTISILKLPQYP